MRLRSPIADLFLSIGRNPSPVSHLTMQATLSHKGDHCVRECRVIPVARWEYACAYLLPHSAHEAASASGARHSPRPLISGRKIHALLGRIAPQDRGVAS